MISLVRCGLRNFWRVGLYIKKHVCFPYTLINRKKLRATITIYTMAAQKKKFSIKDFFSKCDQIRRKLWIWSHLLKKSLMENFFFCAMRTAEVYLRLSNIYDDIFCGNT